MSLDTDMGRSLREMQSTYMNFDAVMRQFQAACVARDWPRVESLRFETVTAIESHLDSMAVTYRRLEVAERGR